MKRIIAAVLVLFLLVVSASAADVYEIEDDTSVISSPVSFMSTDSGVSTAEFTDDDSSYLRLIYDNILNLNTHVSKRFDLYLSDFLSDLDNSLFEIFEELVDVNSSLSDIITEFGTVTADWDTMLTHIDYTYTNSEKIYTRIKEILTAVTTISSDVANVDVDLPAILSSLNLSSGDKILSYSGSEVALDSETSLTSVVNNGLRGLWRQLQFPSATTYINSYGRLTTSDSPQRFVLWMNTSLRGIRATITGSQQENSYTGSVTHNDNTETSFTVNGLGPLLNTWLDAIQQDTGRLTYMFASPEDLEAKKESQSTTESFTDNFLNPDSDASIKLSDVGILKDSSKTVQELGQTGVTPGQAFEQLTGNGSIFSFFTQETANDLDTTVSTYSRGSGNEIVTTYFEDSRAEFFDLIGKGGDE